MITVSGHTVLDMPQDWSVPCQYGLTSKSGRSDSLQGDEDRVMYSSASRRSYRYGILARGLAQRMDYASIFTAALASGRAMVPIWCKQREDFTADGLNLTFTRDFPVVGSYWVLASLTGDLSVLHVTGYSTTDTATFEAVGGDDGLHEGVLVPLLLGYIRAPKSEMVGGDCESYEIEFIQADFQGD